MMKKYMIFCLMLLSSTAYAQKGIYIDTLISMKKDITFCYDASGNRTEEYSKSMPFYTPKPTDTEEQVGTMSLGNKTVLLNKVGDSGLFELVLSSWFSGDTGYYAVYSVGGALMEEQKIVSVNTLIDLSGCPVGYYILSIVVNDEHDVLKISR